MPTFRNFICALFVLSIMALNPLQAWGSPGLAFFNLRAVNLGAIGCDSEILYSVSSYLESDDSLRLLPRRKMEEVLRQAGLNQADNKRVALKAGKVLDVSYVLFGNVEKSSANIISRLNLLHVGQAQIVQTWNQTFASQDDILARSPDLARAISLAVKKGPRFDDNDTAANQVEVIDIDQFTAADQGNSIMLSWVFNPEDPITHFKIFRAETRAGPYQRIGQSQKNRFFDSQIEVDTRYYYKLHAVLRSGEEIRFKDRAHISITGEDALHPPVIITAKGQARSAKIKFAPSLRNKKKSLDIHGYKLYRRASQNDLWQEAAVISSSSSQMTRTVSDKGIDDGTRYSYSLTSLSKEGGQESRYSDPVQVITLHRPTLHAAEREYLRRIDLHWSQQEKSSGYVLYRRKSSRDEWRKIRKFHDPRETKYSDTKGLEDGCRYEYCLRAFDDHGTETGCSNIVSQKTKDLPPPPSNLKAKSNLVKAVRLQWTPVQDQDVGGYIVYRGQDKQLKEIKKVSGHETQSYVDDGSFFSKLEDGQRYVYAVASYNQFGAEGEVSDSVSATTKPRPNRVRGFEAHKRNSYVLLTWNLNQETDIQKYSLYRSRSNSSWSLLDDCRSDQQKYKDQDISPGASYQYKIIAEDKDGLKSDVALSEHIRIPEEEK